MSDSHPVLFVFTYSWCLLCQSLMEPEKWKIFVKDVMSANPRTEIRLITYGSRDPNIEPSEIYPERSRP